MPGSIQEVRRDWPIVLSGMESYFDGQRGIATFDLVEGWRSMTRVLGAKERFELGQQRRRQMRRVEHGTWSAKQRKESPLKLLAASTVGRVPHLVALKNELMAASPFGYFRGAVPVMAYDLSLVGNTGICNQLCGDAHVRNLGGFAGPDGRLIFDINDYDETIVGPFEWDVKRMATSLMLAGRASGTKEPRCQEAAMVFLERYRSMMRAFARMPVLEVARYQVHRLLNVSPVAGVLRAAERATPRHTLLTLTEEATRGKEDGKKARKQARKAAERKKKDDVWARPERLFKTEPPMLKRVTGAMAEEVIGSLTVYRESLQPERRHFLAQYRPVDVAFKVVGTGSVGLRDYCVYMEGNGSRDPLFLQIKEEVASAWTPYMDRVTDRVTGTADRRHKQNQGKRVVDGERAMQVQSDPFLGWTTMQGRDYLVRQLNDHKATVSLDTLKAGELMEYATVCGEMLARGHARSGDSSVIAGYVGTSTRFDEAVKSFATAYADQTEKDWKELVQSLKSGNLKTGNLKTGKKD